MSNVDVNLPAVQNYLGLLQNVIARMASNSSSSKAWCITLVSAIVVFSADRTQPNAIWAAVIPLALFLILDAYYLGLERQFRSVYQGFVHKLHTGSAKVEDLYVIAPPLGPRIVFLSTIKAIASISVWPFYTFIIVMLFIVRSWIY